MLHGRHWETWPRRPLELLANILGAIGNMLLVLVEALAWLFKGERTLLDRNADVVFVAVYDL
jgi:hypothetical protein